MTFIVSGGALNSTHSLTVLIKPKQLSAQNAQNHTHRFSRLYCDTRPENEVALFYTTP